LVGSPSLREQRIGEYQAPQSLPESRIYPSILICLKQMDAAQLEEARRLLAGGAGMEGRRLGKGLLVSLARERFPLTASVDAVPLVGV
jgi:hypothetical protein